MDARVALDKRVAASAVAHALFGAGEPRPTLGRYQLLRRLGAGAMGVVYEALDPRIGRRCALKVLRERGPEARRRLEREVSVRLHVRHQNLVALHELSTESDPPFFAMELIDGVPITDYVWSQGALDVARARHVLRQLVDAVRALHAAGVVHGDLTPANLLVRSNGCLVLLDFGLAHGLEAQEPPRPTTEASDWCCVRVIASEALGLPMDRGDLVAFCRR